MCRTGATPLCWGFVEGVTQGVRCLRLAAVSLFLSAAQRCDDDDEHTGGHMHRYKRDKAFHTSCPLCCDDDIYYTDERDRSFYPLDFCYSFAQTKTSPQHSSSVTLITRLCAERQLLLVWQSGGSVT